MTTIIAILRAACVRHAIRLASASMVLLTPGLIGLPTTAGAQSPDRDAWRDRGVNIVLVDAAQLRDQRARVILRGGAHELATVLLRAEDATEADLLAALGRVQNLYQRTVAPGRIVASDVGRVGEARGLDDARQRSVRGILARVRERPLSTVTGYGAVRWLRLKSTVLTRT